ARDSYEVTGEWTNLVKLSARDRLTVGTLFNHIAGVENLTSTVPYTAVSDGSRNSGALYAQLDHQLSDTVKFIAGFQTNRIGNIPVNTVPRVGVIWTPSAWSVKALYGQAFRAPSLNENLINHPGLEGNPNLLPEKVATFDLGVSYRRNHFEGGVDYFHSRITDSIVNIPDGARFRFVNLGDVVFNGLEVEGKYFFRKDLLLQGSMLKQANHDGNGVGDISPVPI
ncbi:MAG: TonB-dependent receptor, partial [Acidobacteriota bacterium]